MTYNLGETTTDQLHQFEMDSLGLDLAVRVLIVPRAVWRQRPESRDPLWSSEPTPDGMHVVAIRPDLCPSPVVPGFAAGPADFDRLGDQQQPAA